VQQRHRRPNCRGQFACEFYRSLDEFLSTGANKKTLQILAFPDCHEHWRLNRFDHFVGLF